jgi:cyclic dehypoxanthinyl futalosine synthase
MSNDVSIKILEEVVPGRRLDAAEALGLLRGVELPRLSVAAHAVRQRLNPPDRVTYIVDRNVNYTNICGAFCSFCAFARRRGDPDAYMLTHEQLAEKIEETLALGGRQLLLQGGMHPEMGIEAMEEMLRFIKRYPIHIHGFSAPEIVTIARISRLSIRKTLERLRAAGLDTLPGGGAEILVDRVRAALSPGKCTTDEWLDVHRQWHALGGRSTATMMFGHIETLEERIEHLRRVRELQDETGGFTAFIGWPFQPENTELQRREGIGEVGSWDYLRTTAVARLFLDNIAHVQASWVTQGGRIGQIALFYGCDDMGSVMIEENVVRAAGAEFRMDEPTLRRLVEEAGFQPQRRNCFYEPVE